MYLQLAVVVPLIGGAGACPQAGLALVKWRASADTNFNLSVRFFGRWLQGVVGLSQFHLKVHAAVHEPISGSLHAVDEFQDLGDFFTINKVFFKNDYSAHVRKL